MLEYPANALYKLSVTHAGDFERCMCLGLQMTD